MSLMRLDKAVVARGFSDSRSRAQQMITDRLIAVDGRMTSKSATMVNPDAVSLTGQPSPWVSRAALKLDHALTAFALDPTGAVALDVGASTGGFTDVLLSRGAVHVHAIDVGHGQMHARLTDDPRVTNHEGINAKAIPPGLIPPVDWIVSDVSFISLTKALPQPLSLARTGACLVALIKPQFEVGPARVGKGGIVKDAAAREDARKGVRDFLDASGWQVTHEDASPITGSDGNQEYLIAAKFTP